MGGWSNTITQDTKVTIQVAKKAIALLPRFARDYNEYLNQRSLPNVKIGPTVGSTAYISRDELQNPTKEYGDVDVILFLPRIEEMSENKNLVIYWEALENFVMVCNLPYIYEDLDCSGHNIIVKTDEGWVQVDLISTIENGTDWTQMRLTPEYGTKGALLGTLYTALAQTLNLSINNKGVQLKEINGTIVPFRIRDPDANVQIISTCFESFGLDILDAINGEHTRPTKLLIDHHGMSRVNVLISDLIYLIKGLGESFEYNLMFGKGNLSHIKSYEDYIAQVKKIYLERIELAISSTKFFKAEGKAAKMRVFETIDTLRSKSMGIAQLLS